MWPFLATRRTSCWRSTFPPQNSSSLAHWSKWVVHRWFCRYSRKRGLLKGQCDTLPAQCGASRPIYKGPPWWFRRHWRKHSKGLPPSSVELPLPFIERRENRPPYAFWSEAVLQLFDPEGRLSASFHLRRYEADA